MSDLSPDQYTGIWRLLINPITMMWGSYFIALNIVNRDSDLTLYYTISVIIANIIGWTIASYIIIRIVDWCKSK